MKSQRKAHTAQLNFERCSNERTVKLDCRLKIQAIFYEFNDEEKPSVTRKTLLVFAYQT